MAQRTVSSACLYSRPRNERESTHEDGGNKLNIVSHIVYCISAIIVHGDLV